MTDKPARPGRRLALYIPPDAIDVLDAIARIAERHRWSRNKAIVELLRRAVAPHARADRVRS